MMPFLPSIAGGARFVLPVAGALSALALASPAFAEDAAPTIDSGNTAWMLTASVLVLMMTLPGLSLFYGGLVRSKNVLSVLMQCFAICCLVSVLWLAVGYSLAFAAGGPFLGGLGKMFLAGVTVDAIWDGYSIPESLFAMFQLTFAMITPALICGAYAERMKFSAMMLFSGLWLLVVYAPIAHWVWASDGWLFTMGALDFAGGTVVHINAGIAALMAAIVLGRRKGFPDSAMPPHNLTLTVTGACLLWVGWFGFNAGSALAADGSASMTMLVTHMATAGAALGWMACEWLRFGKPSVLGIVTGAIAGLVAVTPASGWVGPVGGVVIGLIASVVCFYATQYMKRTLKLDDSLDVFSVHGVGGIVGALLTGIFVADSLGGRGYADGVTMGSQMVTQVIGVAATLAWSGLMSWVLLMVTNLLIGLRVTEDDETQGLDQALHEERGYIL